ncbi:MAG: urea ABC transporter ATP-binding subunit UrtE [Acidobacteriota bacterium]|nr:urea ABC transporter ATP-binding subunit UrtE [Acidobacteriota bacterium]
MLEARGITQSYGQGRILWGVDLEVPRGSCVAILGRNGVGKTTLVKCLMGLLRTDAGSLSFDGEEISSFAPERRAGLGIGYVPQGRMIFPMLTVEENLLVGMTARRDGASDSPNRVFELFPVLRDMLARRGGDLSGGQQQQLAIARALALDPRFLILDEPCEGIQPNIVHQIGDVIVELNQELGQTVLLVEQKLPFVRRVASQFAIMAKGNVVAHGKMSALTDDMIQQHLTV